MFEKKTMQDESSYKLPPIDLLRGEGRIRNSKSPAAIKADAEKLEQVLRDFYAGGQVLNVTIRPNITRYEVKPDTGVRIESIKGLEQDLALLLGANNVRVVALTERSVIEIEAYYNKPDIVSLRDNAEAMSRIAPAPSVSQTEKDDELFNEAVEMITQSGTKPKQVSVSMLQRHFRIGYNRASGLLDMMEERGIVSAADGTNKPRQVIISEES